jgi:hypothetical protein
VIVYAGAGQTIYADFDIDLQNWTEKTSRTSGASFAIPQGGATLYYYAEDAYYTEDVKTLAIGIYMTDLSGNTVTSTDIAGNSVTSTPLGG